MFPVSETVTGVPFRGMGYDHAWTVAAAPYLPLVSEGEGFGYSKP